MNLVSGLQNLMEDWERADQRQEAGRRRDISWSAATSP